MIETTTNGQRLLIVPVPKDAADLKCNGQQIGYDTPDAKVYQCINLPFEINDGILIGTLHVENGKPVLSEGFDFIGLLGNENKVPKVKLTMENILAHLREKAFDLITSAITKAGYSWGNPLGKEPLYPNEPTFTPGWEDEEFEMALRGYERDRKEYEAWQQAESKAIHKAAVIKIGG